MKETIEFLGEPMKNSFILHAVKGEEEQERDVLYFSITGAPSTFVVFDVNQKKILRSLRHGADLGITHTEACWSSVKDGEGNVYSAVGGHPGYVLKYSPRDGQLVSLSPVGEEIAVYHLTCDEDGNVYGGSYPSGKVFRCTPDGAFEDYGSPVPDNMYVISSVYYQGSVYGGTRGTNPVFFRFDLKRRTTHVIPLPSFMQQRLVSYYYMTRLDEKLFVDVKTMRGNYFLLCYDLERECWTDFCEKGMGGQHISEPLDGKAYFVDHMGNFREISLDTLAVSDTGILYYPIGGDVSSLDYANGIMGGGFFRLDDQEHYPGYTYITPNYDQNTLAYINLELKTVEFIDNCDFIKNPVRIHAIETMEDGRIMLGAYMGTKIGIFEPQQQEYTYLDCRQSEGILACGNKIYMGIYTRAVIWEYDVEQPYVKGKNPKPLFEVGEEQDRPFSLCNAGGRLAVATVPDYGRLGGAVTLYDWHKKQKRVFRNIIKDESVTAICYRDGYLYGTTGIFGGLGAAPAEQEAMVFRFSVESGKLECERAIGKELGYDNVFHIGGIGFDPYGTLWGIAGGVVFTLDPQTLAVEKKVDISGVPWTRESFNAWRPFYLVFLDDYLYCNPNEKLVRIHLKTLEYKEFEQNAYVMTAGKDGNVYFTSGTKFYRLKRE